ncbi:MAG: hypothetical protein HDR24_11015 [Lachnospiraceae bacterium]|nr:hypothetical protein [Lachnospiraceae bacterium]
MRNGEQFENHDYLELMEDGEEFKKLFRLFFRAIGTEDTVFAAVFEEDSALMAEKGLAPEMWNAHIERKYQGDHCWHVWRQAIYDFLQLIFRESAGNNSREENFGRQSHNNTI